MAAETPVIEIRTLEAVKNVKELKENISALKAKIDDVNTSTDEYADLTRELSQNQAALRNVMNGTNSAFDVSIKDAQGLTTSYNSLVQQLKSATQEWRTIPRYLSEADQAQGKVNQAWTDAANKVERLRSELKDMDATTGNFTRNVGNYKSALDGFSGTMGRVQQIGGDMVNGISAAASSLSMLGIDTDGLTDSMKNLRIVTAAVQGAKGFAGLIGTLAKFVTGQKAATNATKADTAAQRVEATALEQTAAAETAAATAGSVLRTVLQTLGIGIIVTAVGLLVAHLEDVVKWLGGVAEKLGIIKKSNTDGLVTAEKVKENYEKQKDELDKQVRIMQAQGRSQRDILRFQIQQIDASIATKEAEVESAKATLERLKQHTAIGRLLRGESKEYREAKKVIEETSAELDEMKKAREGFKFDLELEGYKDQTDARNKAIADAKKAEEDYLRAVKDSEKAVSKLLDTELTEYQAIKKEHLESLHSINDVYLAEKERLEGLKETEKSAKKIAEYDEKIAELSAKIKQNTEIVSEYYEKNKYAEQSRKEFAEAAEKAITASNYAYEKGKDIALSRARLLKDILGYSNEQVKAAGNALTIEEKATLEANRRMRTYDNIGKLLSQIEGYDFPNEIMDINTTLSDLVVRLTEGKETIESAYEMSILNPDMFKEMFDEPIRTAIKEWGSAYDQTQAAFEVEMKNFISGAFNNINNAIDSGDYLGADKMITKLLGEVDDMPQFGPIRNELADEIKKFYTEVYKEIMESENPLAAVMAGKGTWKKLFDTLYNAPVESAKSTLAQLRQELSQMDEFNAAYTQKQEEIDAAEVKLYNARMKRLEAWNKQAGKYLSSYGKATSSLLGSVADAWEEGLKAQGKTNEEAFSGVKMLQSAAAVINTAAAVVQALADPTVPSYTVKAINAAAALAAGTAQIIKINNTKYGDDASSSTGETPRLVDRTPQLQYTVGLNPQDYAAAQAQNPIRAYVVDRDLSEGLDEYNRRKDETTF